MHNAEFYKTIKELMFIAETTAHLRGLEREILPTVDKMREMLNEVEKENSIR